MHDDVLHCSSPLGSLYIATGVIVGSILNGGDKGPHVGDVSGLGQRESIQSVARGCKSENAAIIFVEDNDVRCGTVHGDAIVFGEVVETHDVGNSVRVVPDGSWVVAKITLLSKCHNPGITVEIEWNV